MQNRKALTYISYADTGTRNHIKSSKRGGFRPAAKTGGTPRIGKICPACGLQRSLTGVCDCNA